MSVYWKKQTSGDLFVAYQATQSPETEREREREMGKTNQKDYLSPSRVYPSSSSKPHDWPAVLYLGG